MDKTVVGEEEEEQGNPMSSEPTSLEMETKQEPSSSLLSSLCVREEATSSLEARLMHQAEQIANVEKEKHLEQRRTRLNLKLEKIDKRLKLIRSNMQSITENNSGSNSSKRKLMNLMDEEEAVLEQRNAVLAELEPEDVDNEEERDNDLLGVDQSERAEAIRKGTMTAFGTELRTEDDNSNNEFVVDEAEDIGKAECLDEINNSEALPEDEQSRESKDDVEQEAKGSSRVSSRKQRVLDDGDRDVYLDRLQGVVDDDYSSSKDEESSKRRYERLEGGLLVPRSIWTKLFVYQKVGVQWLWELHQQSVGGILGDEMGLGKTVQIIAFLAALYCSRQKEEKEGYNGATLIVAPTTVMHQWVKEFHTWWPSFRVSVLHESGSFKGPKPSLIRVMSKCNKGVLITSYNGLVAYQEALTEANFDHVILDEGHKIRNPDAQVTLAAKCFPTAHRIILSGSPLQNNLKELWSLFDFVYPGKLGTLPVFMAQFSIPITQGGYANASRVQVATAYKCATILRDTINPYLLRRMKSDVRHHLKLPEKNEQVLFCRLTDEQRQLYRKYLDSKDVQGILNGRLQSFVGLMNLRKICNHPDLFEIDNSVKATTEDVDESAEYFGYWRRSGKMIVVEALLKLWKKQKHRVLLFSQSKQMLYILEQLVKQRNYTYLRMDGTTAIGSRQPLIDRFNRDESIFIFLLTTKVGGLGVNLIGASRVVIFDPDWNPSTDTQARERAWRIGQQRQVTIYRLLMASTIEEKIYHRQIFKQYLVNRVLKDPSQKRFFKTNDLHELFTLNEANEDKDTESSALFAGTGSEVNLSKGYTKEKKRRRAKDDGQNKDLGEDGNKWSRPLKVPRVEKDKNKTEVVSETLNLALDEDEEQRRERLLEQVRRINALFKKSDGSTENDSDSGKQDENLSVHNEEGNSRKIRRKDQKKKGAKFEGKSIPHLVKARKQKRHQEDKSEASKMSKRESAEQDSYVLSKLFKRTNGMMHSALQHDVIESGGKDGNSDYSLIEAEAERVAKEAIAKVRQSRSQCFRAETGVPTFTGSSGFLRKNKLSKIKKRSESGPNDEQNNTAMFSGSKRSIGLLSSSQLLKRIRQRNRYDEGFAVDTEIVSEQVELINDIRVFVKNQDECKVSTKALISRFGNRLPPKDAPLFKALLKEVCDFTRIDGRGMWLLRAEFR